MTIPWLTGISLLLRLSCLSLVEGITVSKPGAAVSHTSTDNPSLPGSFTVDVPSRILQAPGENRCELNSEADKRIVNYEAATAAPVIPLGWSEAQPGRRYLPPHRVVGSYGPPGVVPIEGGSPLYTPSYSSESWNTLPNVRAQLNRDRKKEVDEENGGYRDDGEAKKHDDGPVGDTKPVYELTNDEISNDGRDYGGGPEGNRARDQSTGPNTVTSLGHHRPADSHEFPRDASAAATAAVATSFSTLDWLLADKGYNSPLHPPPNPIISLVLSHYGRYIPGPRQPKFYSYMAVNNIHNNRPFGQYKLSSDEAPDVTFVK